jgi:hypothetical protein
MGVKLPSNQQGFSFLVTLFVVTLLVGVVIIGNIVFKMSNDSKQQTDATDNIGIEQTKTKK